MLGVEILHLLCVIRAKVGDVGVGVGDAESREGEGVQLGSLESGVALRGRARALCACLRPVN
jgi:hypothetical protein